MLASRQVVQLRLVRCTPKGRPGCHTLCLCGMIWIVNPKLFLGSSLTLDWQDWQGCVQVLTTDAGKCNNRSYGTGCGAAEMIYLVPK